MNSIWDGNNLIGDLDLGTVMYLLVYLLCTILHWSDGFRLEHDHQGILILYFSTTSQNATENS